MGYHIVLKFLQYPTSFLKNTSGFLDFLDQKVRFWSRPFLKKCGASILHRYAFAFAPSMERTTTQKERITNIGVMGRFVILWSVTN